MRISYEGINKKTIIDGDGVFVLTRNNVGIYMDETTKFRNKHTDDVMVLSNFHIRFVGGSFKSKIISTVKLIKFIWRG